ncbi:MAG: 30S ribosomal protein S16 [Candidatus Izemoplasma sp.]
MAVKLRLQRYGSKKRPFYRLVASDSRMKRDGRYLEILGTYDPTNEPATIKIDEEKALKWMAVGAKPTDTVKNLLKQAGISSSKQDKK